MFSLCMLDRSRLVTLPGGSVVPVGEAIIEEEVEDIFEGKFQLHYKVKK